MTYDGVVNWDGKGWVEGTVVTVNINLEQLMKLVEAMTVLKVAGIRWKPTFNCATFISVCLLHERIHTPDKLYRVLTGLTSED
jgi:hypothetical protein